MPDGWNHASDVSVCSRFTPDNSQAGHTALESGGLEAEPFGGSSYTPNSPVGAVQDGANVIDLER